MIFPLSKAHPAEVPAANLALHVVAACAFLDGPGALRIWAHFCIRYDPGQIFTFTRIFEFPIIKHLAIRGPMLLFSALEAIRIAARAAYNILLIVFIYFLRGILALFREGAPFHIFVIVSKRLAVPAEIFAHNLLFTFRGIRISEKFKN